MPDNHRLDNLSVEARYRSPNMIDVLRLFPFITTLTVAVPAVNVHPLIAFLTPLDSDASKHPIPDLESLQIRVVNFRLDSGLRVDCYNMVMSLTRMKLWKFSLVYDANMDGIDLRSIGTLIATDISNVDRSRIRAHSPGNFTPKRKDLEVSARIIPRNVTFGRSCIIQ
jgi:hypothetical protein